MEQSPDNRTGEQLLRCPNCRAPVTPGQRFCGECGSRLIQICPTCGTENPQHLDLFAFAGNEALAQEAREMARSVDFLPSRISAEIDLLLNFARRGKVADVETLIPGVAAHVEKAAGFHGWLWRLRLAEARAELALARGDWTDAVVLADEAIRQSGQRGRLKYQALGLRSRAWGLQGVGREREAIGELRRAVALARPVGDPALLVNVATPLLALAGDDALLAEVRAAAERIVAATPNDTVKQAFLAAEPVQLLWKLSRKPPGHPA